MLSSTIRIWLTRGILLVCVAVGIFFLVHLRVAFVPQTEVATMPNGGVWFSAFNVKFVYSGAEYRRQLGLSWQQLRNGQIELLSKSGLPADFKPLLKAGWSNSVKLFAVAMTLGSFLGILLGLAYGTRAKWLRGTVSGGSILVLSIPEFVLIVLGQMLGIWLTKNWGLRPWTVLANPDSFKGWILPTLVLGAIPMAYLARLMASAMEEVMAQEYIRAARARGIPEWRVVSQHAFRNALPQVLAGLPFVLPVALGALVVVERLTNWPGMARWLIVEGGVRIIADGPRTYVGDIVILQAQWTGVTPVIVTVTATVFVSMLLFLDGLAQSLGRTWNGRLRGQ